MKRIGCVLLLTACVIGLHGSWAAAQSGTTENVPGVSSPIMQGGVVEGGVVEGGVMQGGVVEGGVVEGGVMQGGVVQGPVEGAMEPIPQSYPGVVVGNGGACCNGGTTGVPPYQSYSTGYPGYGYGYGYYPTYRTGWSYGYRPVFGGLFSRRNIYYCCP